MAKNVNLDKTNDLVWETAIQTVGSSNYMKEKFKKEVLLMKDTTVKSKIADLKVLDRKLKSKKSLEDRTLDSISQVEIAGLQGDMEQKVYQITKDKLMQNLSDVRQEISKLED